MASAHLHRLLARSREEPVSPAEREEVRVHLATCAECASLERRLADNDRVLSTREPTVVVPARIRSAGSRSKPRAWVRLGAAVVVALVALVAGVTLGNYRASVASPTHPPQPAAALPTPLVLGNGTVDPGFGFVNTDIASPTGAPLITVRSEPSSGVVTSVRGGLPNVAVSPNGQRVAIWASSTNAAGNGQSFQLVVYDTIARTWTAPLFTSVSEVPRAIVWSSDGTGLVFATASGAGRGPAGTQVHSSWFSLETANAQARELGALEGVADQVYSWDRSTDTITASGLVPSAKGGSEANGVFLVLAQGQLRSFPITARWLVAAADSYGRSVVLVAGANCDDGTLRCAKAEVRDQRSFEVTSPEFSLARTPARDYPTVIFRPRSQDLIVWNTYFSAPPTVDLWKDLGRGARIPLFRPGLLPKGGITATDVNRIITRPDGSAAFLLQFDSSRTGRWYGGMVSFLDGSFAGYLDFFQGGNPLLSVILDPAYAARIDGRTPPPALCDTYVQAVLPSPGVVLRYPTRTAQQTRVGLTSDPNFRHLLEDIAGVRQDSNPLRDPRVPRCDVAALDIGEPVFVRNYPSYAGRWYVPILYQGSQVLVAMVGRDDVGQGSQSGAIGGSAPYPSLSELTAKQAGGTPSDAAVSVERVFARPASSRVTEPAWRVVRASGAVVYVFPSLISAGPNAVLPENQVVLGN